jgi:hypothetical protein
MECKPIKRALVPTVTKLNSFEPRPSVLAGAGRDFYSLIHAYKTRVLLLPIDQREVINTEGYQPGRVVFAKCTSRPQEERP